MKLKDRHLCNLLITGAEQKDRLHYAKTMAKLALCLKQENTACDSCVNCHRVALHKHPNLFFIEPGLEENESLNDSDRLNEYSGTIKIEKIRQILVEHQKANFENGISIFIITHMHKVTKASANALLKVMEETNANKLFMALAPSRMTVLPTIASRLVCHMVKPSKEEVVVDKKAYDRIRSITPLNPLSRFHFMEDFATEREDLYKEIDDLICTCHILIRKKPLSAFYILPLLEAFQKAQKNLQRNQNPRLILENLIMHDWPMMSAICANSAM